MGYEYLQRERRDERTEAGPNHARAQSTGQGMQALLAARAASGAAQDGRPNLDEAMKARMEQTFGDLSGLSRQQTGGYGGGGFLADSAAKTQAGHERTTAPFGEGGYTGPVTSAVSSSRPTPFMAGVMQAKRTKPYSADPEPDESPLGEAGPLSWTPAFDADLDTPIQAPPKKAKPPKKKPTLDLGLDDPIQTPQKKTTSPTKKTAFDLSLDPPEEADEDASVPIQDAAAPESQAQAESTVEEDTGPESREHLLTRRILNLRETPNLRDRALHGVFKLMGEDGRESPLSGQKLSDQDDAYQFFGVDKGGSYDQWRSGLSWDEQDAINRYTADSDPTNERYKSGNFQEINSALRSGKGLDEMPKDLAEQIRSMDSAIEKSELNEPIIVNRKSSADLLYGLTDPDEIMELFGGKVLQDPAFLSTSAANKGSLIDGEIIYRIAVPAGKGRGAFLDPMSEYQGENEFLLKRDTKLVVMNAYKEGDKTVVELQA